ncbi:MraY family glycosyltransferase [Caulobacter sp. 17J65-9]|uniref:MraY family glycosyltransferase n=1 Tax=Caulobacter sp. 17J65-9 TaxID=2709382 RepID=UPI0013CB4B8C|nr:MraY family glycosyltransferase [Caulobacter sp. 17J65-9]NEX92345.1 undecaprenyl/decaprenyl-phosphate alpha-N-acetylglucosaminyl 1-phosphate transferase [Caulobacter sp. 17J65-9]
MGLVDQPSGRKQHRKATPMVGGLAIALAVVVALTFGAVFEKAAVVQILAEHRGFLIGSAVLVLVGVLDDISPIKARYKLAFQFACCTLAVMVDQVMINSVADVDLGVMAGPFTVLVMLTVLNGLNMIDGIDGLAGGTAFVGVLFMAAAAAAFGRNVDALLMGAFAGALIAFLARNFPLRRGGRASVFLGDAGSLLLGFVLAYFAIRLSDQPGRVFRHCTAFWFFFVPVADAILLYVRRFLRDGAPFAAGRDHIHHILLRRWSARSVCWFLIGATATLAGLSYLVELAGISPLFQVAGWLVLFGLYASISHRPWAAAWLRSRRAERRRAKASAPMPVFVEARRAA